MRLLVTGGTGFIGAPLCRFLIQHGHEVVVITRSPAQRAAGIRFISWQTSEWERAVAEVDGVINLAGEPLAAKRWSPRQKQAIRDSRITTTRALVQAIAVHGRKPSVLINASAVGYYGPRQDEALTEHDPSGRGFLAETCQAWEAEARRAEALGMRVIRLRFGLVLGPPARPGRADGGALAKMAPPFRAFIGGPLGSGRQWVSWIHRDDVLGLIQWALAHPTIQGAVNATAPAPVTMREFCHALGRALHRPSWAPVPGPALRLLLGEMSDMLLTGQRVLPRVAQDGGYAFQHSEITGALAACFPQ